MGLLRRICILTGSCLLLSSGLFSMEVRAEGDVAPILYGNPRRDDAVIQITEDAGTYKVLPGDSLWSISEKIWGDDSGYQDLLKANPQLMNNPSALYPGMILQATRGGYILRNNLDYAYMQTPLYNFDCPEGDWYYGMLEMGETWANSVVYQDGLCDIACLIQDREAAAVRTTEDWEACRQTIRDYVDANYRDCVSDLSFSHYLVNGKEDLYLYSFIYEMNLADYDRTGSIEYLVCMGLRLTDHIQAQFIGFSPLRPSYDYDIPGAVRYVAASFEETWEEDAAETSVNDSNMQIMPDQPWEAEGLFNPFAWIDAFSAGAAQEHIGPREEDIDKKQQLLEGLHAFPIRPVGP